MAGGRIEMLPCHPGADRIGHGARRATCWAIARIAGIQAAKKTSELIPLCHPLALTPRGRGLSAREAGGWCAAGDCCTATAETVGPTGVEMEALTAVQVALLTIYDMCKAVDRGMAITDVRVLEKHGGKSGHFIADTAGK